MKIAVAIVVALIPTIAAAQPKEDPKFSYGKADDLKDVKATTWEAAAEIGIILTTGNAETTTATAGGKASRKSGDNKLELAVQATYARSGLRIAADGPDADLTVGPHEITTQSKTTAETIEGKLRYDRFFKTLNSVYIAALGKRDVPAGKALNAGGQVGYSRQLVKTDTATAVAEIGYDVSYEDLVAPGDPAVVHSARLFAGYKLTIAETTAFEASIEALVNLVGYDTPTGRAGVAEDTRINGNATWTSKVGGDLSFAFGLQIKYDNVPAPLAIPNTMFDPGFVPESSEMDTVFKASLIYSFL